MFIIAPEMCYGRIYYNVKIEINFLSYYKPLQVKLILIEFLLLFRMGYPCLLPIWELWMNFTKSRLSLWTWREATALLHLANWMTGFEPRPRDSWQMFWADHPSATPNFLHSVPCSSKLNCCTSFRHLTHFTKDYFFCQEIKG